jgi:tRNA(Ile)-lysidine synthase
MALIDHARAALEQAAETSAVNWTACSLVVAVSGGPDSLALLHVLVSLVEPAHLIVAHLDHGLRPESAAEARLVAALAKDLRLHSERVDVHRLAQVERLTLEEAARVARYDFLARVARLESAPVIVTGHHAGDQAETVLMHLLRGSGLAGLRGMRPAARLPGHPDLWLWRPLLTVSRATIEAYCADNDLEPLQDASNADPTFFRNRLRHELLPRLEQYNPQIRSRLSELAEIVAADEELLADATARAWAGLLVAGDAAHVALRLDGWRALPLGLRRRTLRRAIAALQPGLRDVSFRALEMARQVAEAGQTGARAELPDGLALSVAYGRLLVATVAYDAAAGYPQLLASESQPLAVPGVVDLAQRWQIVAEIIQPVNLEAVSGNADPWTAYVALEPGTALFVRGRRPGERLRPLGLGGETKLKEVMIDRKLPVATRALWPVVATAAHPVWLAGHVIDERVRVRPDSDHVVLLRVLAPAVGQEW